MRKKREILLKFRNGFQKYTADGRYTAERQQHLYQWCGKLGLDWDEAWIYVRPQAQTFLQSYRQKNPQNTEDIEQFKRWFKLTDQPTPLNTYVLNVPKFKSKVARLRDQAFEDFTRDMLVFLGWTNVTVVGGGNDKGADVKGEYEGYRYIVQCKRLGEKKVGAPAVRNLIGSMHIHKAERAIFVTTSEYTRPCYDIITGQPVELWTLDDMSRNIQKALKAIPKTLPQELHDVVHTAHKVPQVTTRPPTTDHRKQPTLVLIAVAIVAVIVIVAAVLF